MKYIPKDISLDDEYKYSKRFWKKFKKYRFTVMESYGNISKEMYDRYQVNGFILRYL